MVENVIGTFELPFGIGGYFQVNGRDVLVPMVVEEPSVVAAASFMAKLARDCGGFETSSTGPLMRAQVQVHRHHRSVRRAPWRCSSTATKSSRWPTAATRC